jgi:hypothetical protein
VRSRKSFSDPLWYGLDAVKDASPRLVLPDPDPMAEADEVAGEALSGAFFHASIMA